LLFREKCGLQKFSVIRRRYTVFRFKNSAGKRFSDMKNIFHFSEKRKEGTFYCFMNLLLD